MVSYQDVVRRYRNLPPGAVNATVDAIATALALTDEEIHLHTGISRPTINAMRCGRRAILPDRLWPIASALDVDVERGGYRLASTWNTPPKYRGSPLEVALSCHE